jgi:hypothetical protein
VTSVFVKAGFNLPFLFYEILWGTRILSHTYEYRSTTFGILGRTDFFPEYPVHTNDFAVTLFDFKVLKIVLFQHIDDTFPCSESFQSFDDIDFSVLNH